jgi:hypothetical protein
MRKTKNSEDLAKAVISVARKFISELKKMCENPSLKGAALKERLRRKLKEFESILDFLEFTRKLTQKSKKT